MCLKNTWCGKFDQAQKVFLQVKDNGWEINPKFLSLELLNPRQECSLILEKIFRKIGKTLALILIDFIVKKVY